MSIIKKVSIISGVLVLVSALMLTVSFVVGVWSILTGAPEPTGKQPFRV